MSKLKFLNKNLLIHSQTQSIKKCRLCKSDCLKRGYLFKCSNISCLSLHWDVKSLRQDHEIIFKKKTFNENKQEINEKINVLLQEAGYKNSKGKNSTSVYVLRLSQNTPGTFNERDETLPKCYVGLTGLTPVHRMLNHIRGHKTAKIKTKFFTRCLIYTEENYNPEEGKKREETLHKELNELGWNAFGGH